MSGMSGGERAWRHWQLHTLRKSSTSGTVIVYTDLPKPKFGTGGGARVSHEGLP